MALSFVLMALALRSLPFGTAYAVWTGIGAVGSILVGMLLYSEPTDPVRIICLTLIIAGMVGLKLNSPVCAVRIGQKRDFRAEATPGLDPAAQCDRDRNPHQALE